MISDARRRERTKRRAMNSPNVRLSKRKRIGGTDHGPDPVAGILLDGPELYVGMVVPIRRELLTKPKPPYGYKGTGEFKIQLQDEKNAGPFAAYTCTPCRGDETEIDLWYDRLLTWCLQPN